MDDGGLDFDELGDDSQEGEGDLEDFDGGGVVLESMPQIEPQREWPVFLLEGRQVRGPFHRADRDGAPLVDVHEEESRRDPKTGRAMLVRTGHMGRVRADADELELGRRFGPGKYYLSVRGSGGTILAGGRVQIGRGSRRPDAGEAPRASSPGGGSAFEQSVLSVVEALGAQNRQLADQVLKLHQERQQAELALLRERVAAAPAPGAPSDPLAAARAAFQQADAWRQLLAQHVGAPAAPEPEPTFMDEALGTLEDIKESADRIQQLGRMLGMAGTET